MKKLKYSVVINASAEKIYNTMLGLNDKKTYEQWTALFHPTSTFEGSWMKGSKMYFIGLDEEEKRGGMVSEIAENLPNKFISIRHIGLVKGENEITSGPEVEAWAGCLENYAFNESDGNTTVSIEVEMSDDHASYFNTTWPMALEKLKEISERG